MTVEPVDTPLADGGTGRVLRATGELDIAVVPALLPDVADMVAGADGVVLDLSDVGFFDSSGVRLVDRVARECRRTGARLRVVAPPQGRARRVLEIVGMAGALVADDLPTALASVQATGPVSGRAAPPA